MQVKLFGKAIIGREFDTRWGNQDAELMPSAESQVAKKARAVQLIVQERFGFPNMRYPRYRTYLNYPDRTMGVRTHGEEDPLFPDIVAIDQQDFEVVMTAEVEVPGTVNETAAADWELYSRKFKAAFYLFVPVGSAEDARRLLKKRKIWVAGLRTWRETPYGVEVNEV